MLLAARSMLLAVPAGPGTARAQTYPDRPVHLLVGLPAGGGADVVARTIAAALGERLGQQVVVENRTGSAGLVAADAVAKAAADGHTLLFGSVSTSAIFASLYRKLPYDTLKDFAPISLLATYPLVLVVGASSPVQTIEEFVARAKSMPGQLSYASAGPGSPLHLAMEMLKSKTGIDVVHVPYRGGVQAIGDLLNDRVHAIFDALPTQLANIQGGKVRAIAVTGRSRAAQLPSVPTLGERAVQGFEFNGWFALFAPAGVAQSVVSRLHADVIAALGASDIKQRLTQLGVEPAPSSPAELASFQRDEIAAWGHAVRLSGATVE
jgi:tripartite-type tricarboxylate transporter receptor subunit TctC